MKNIVVDDNGNVVDELALRNEEIKANLEPKLQHFIEKQEADIKGKHKWGFQFQMQIVEELNKYPLMTTERFSEITADDIWDYYKKFHSLMAHYNMHFEIVPNVELFMGFMGINMRMYLNLKEGGFNEDEEIKDIINFLETNVLGNSWGAIDHGNADVKAVSKRISAKGVHEVVSAVEQEAIDKARGMTDDELAKKLLKRGITIIDENRRLK